MYTTPLWVNTENTAVPSFRQASITADRKTIKMVAGTANSIETNITLTIPKSIINGGMRSSVCSIFTIFRKLIKAKHPMAISQNRLGIKKYAAG